MNDNPKQEILPSGDTRGEPGFPSTSVRLSESPRDAGTISKKKMRPKEAKGLSPRLERAVALVAAGMAQKDAAAAAGIRADYLCRAINSEKGQQRYRYWLAREVTRLAPKAIRSLDAALDGDNATAAVRAAESTLDRSGLHADDMRDQYRFESEGLILHIDLRD